MCHVIHCCHWGRFVFLSKLTNWLFYTQLRVTVELLLSQMLSQVKAAWAFTVRVCSMWLYCNYIYTCYILPEYLALCITLTFRWYSLSLNTYTAIWSLHALAGRGWTVWFATSFNCSPDFSVITFNQVMAAIKSNGLVFSKKTYLILSGFRKFFCCIKKRCCWQIWKQQNR